MIKVILAAILLCCFNIGFARIEVSLRPHQPRMGQELQLIIRQVDGITGGLPDFSLLHQDFDIIGSQQSASYHSINGQSQREHIWTLMLMPKHAGKIIIPAIKIGNESTEAQTIDVKPAQTASSKLKIDDGGQTSFLDWHLGMHRPVVHEQVLLAIKIYHLQPLLDAKLQPPTVKNGLLFALEQALRYFETKNGVRYEVEEYRYVIYPQKSGKMEISPPVLDAIEYGLVPTPVHVSLNPMRIMVEPPPAGQTLANWLPAQKLEFKDLKPLAKKMGIPVGDTIVRQLQLTAFGMPAQLIPDVLVNCGKGCKAYVNPPKIMNKMQKGNLVGRKTFDVTYLFSELGERNIPEIQIPWFNTSTRSLETLVIPGVAVDVFRDRKESNISNVSSSSSPQAHMNSWFFAIIGFIGGGLLMRFQSKWSWRKAMHLIKGLEFEHYALKKACLNHDAEKARLEIIAAAKKAGLNNNIVDLHDIIAELSPSDFRDELQTLMTYLFSKRQGKKWHGIRFWRAFKAFGFKSRVVPYATNPLSKLNP